VFVDLDAVMMLWAPVVHRTHSAWAAYVIQLEARVKQSSSVLNQLQAHT
jgi:hypothetical protein